MTADPMRTLERFGFSLYMIRVTLAASLSWMTVHALYGNEFLYFAPLAAILITQGTVKASLEKGICRLIGIVLGGLVGLVVGAFLPIGPLSILLILLIGLGIATACRINFQAITQVGVTSVLALTFYQDHYVLWRATETLIGVAIALLVNMLVVPPKNGVRAKGLALEGSLMLADSLSGLAPGRDEACREEAVKRSGKLLKESAEKENELRFTIFHLQRRTELGRLMPAASHLRVIHGYVKDIASEMRLLPPAYAGAEGMREVLAATADCIALLGAKHLSDAVCDRSMAETVRLARSKQLEVFAGLQGQCELTAMRDLGAVFSHLNRILDEVEQADFEACAAAPRQARLDAARALRVVKNGLTSKF
ncbi:FUSC family protein [Paenibacillus spiritus]|nr:FUSC family protein [Paenibacillus spiritus]